MIYKTLNAQRRIRVSAVLFKFMSERIKNIYFVKGVSKKGKEEKKKKNLVTLFKKF